MTTTTTNTPGYKDARYYAGLYRLARRAFDNEVAYNERALASPLSAGNHEFHRQNLAMLTSGREMAMQPEFSASLDDERYGYAWRIHAASRR